MITNRVEEHDTGRGVGFITREPCIPDYVISVWDKLSQETRRQVLLQQAEETQNPRGDGECEDASHQALAQILTPEEQKKVVQYGDLMRREYQEDLDQDFSDDPDIGELLGQIGDALEAKGGHIGFTVFDDFGQHPKGDQGLEL